MKISFMTFACPEWRLERVIVAAQQFGYHGIEFRCDANHHHGVEVSALPEERKVIRAQLERAGLEPCCLATSLQFVTDRVLDEAPARISLAADIGCPALRVFCGPLPPLMDMAEAVERVGQQLHAVAEMAHDRGVDLWLETHDSFCRGADAGAAARLANHRNVGINYDNVHPFRRGESVEATFAALGPLIRHTHFHDALNLPDQAVIKPVGQGEMPIDQMFRSLVDIDYNGYLSGEWFHDQYGATPADALEAFHHDMTNLAQRHGVRLE